MFVCRNEEGGDDMLEIWGGGIMEVFFHCLNVGFLKVTEWRCRGEKQN